MDHLVDYICDPASFVFPFLQRVLLHKGVAGAADAIWQAAVEKGIRRSGLGTDVEGVRRSVNWDWTELREKGVDVPWRATWMAAPLGTALAEEEVEEETEEGEIMEVDEEEGMERKVAVVIDITDLGRVKYGVVGRMRREEGVRCREVLSVKQFCELVCGGETELGPFPEYPIIEDDILSSMSKFIDGSTTC